jgi:hypothetical protein
MVVLVHACVTYSGLGSWFYNEPSTLDVASKLVFYVYEIFSQAFFMGLLFFVAAAFIPSAFDRKGFGRFVADRSIRLGVPALVFMLLLDPLTNIIKELGTSRFTSLVPWIRGWVSDVTSGRFFSYSGPLWFAVALLIFSLAYALVRLVADRLRPSGVVRAAQRPLSNRSIHLAALALVAVIVLSTFFVRLIQPIGTSWLNMQLCFFPQYIVLFVVWLWAGRTGFLQALPRQVGMAWLRLAFAVGVPAWFLLMALGGALSVNEAAYAGGWHWQAAVLTLWESFFCVAVSLGLLVLYREKANAKTKVTGLLSDTCFGIYVFHAPMLVGASMVLRTMALHPLAKTLLVALMAWMISMAVAWLVRHVPGLRRIIA